MGGLRDFTLHGFQNGREAGKRRRIRHVIAVFSCATIDDEPGLSELREMVRYPGLAHAEDFLELHDGEFLTPQQQQHPQPRRVGDECERFYD